MLTAASPNTFLGNDVAGFAVVCSGCFVVVPAGFVAPWPGVVTSPEPFAVVTISPPPDGFPFLNTIVAEPVVVVTTISV